MGKRTTDERFDAKWELDPKTGCHLWQGGLNNGYGTFRPDGRVDKKVYAHIWAYVRKYGPVPPGKILDHFHCDNPPCCNPDHVRPVTSRENTLRSDTSRAALNLSRTHCPHGHPYADGNLYISPQGGRTCLTCRRETDRRRDARPERSWKSRRSSRAAES